MCLFPISYGLMWGFSFELLFPFTRTHPHPHALLYPTRLFLSFWKDIEVWHPGVQVLAPPPGRARARAGSSPPRVSQPVPVTGGQEDAGAPAVGSRGILVVPGAHS